jgi:hypothetical protein
MEESEMDSYPQIVELREFLEGFKQRYVVEDTPGRRVLAVTTLEASILGKFLFGGIVHIDSYPSLDKSLEKYAKECAGEQNLVVNADEEDLKAFGAFFMQGFVGVVLTIDQARMALAQASAKYRW